MPTCYVYRHTSPSGKSYVGWTLQSVERRWRKHVSDARKGVGACPAFHRAIRKYGADAFTHEVLECMTTTAGAKRAEQLWIRELGTFGEGGYNLTTGGDGNPGHSYVPTAETRAKLSVALAGKTHAPETRAKMSASQRKRPPQSADAIARSAAGRRGGKRTAQQRANMSEGVRSKCAAEDRSARATNAALSLWQDPSRRAALLRARKEKVSAERRSEIARFAALALWEKRRG